MFSPCFSPCFSLACRRLTAQETPKLDPVPKTLRVHASFNQSKPPSDVRALASDVRPFVENGRI